MTTAAQVRAALVSVGGLGGQGWSLDTIAAGADDAMRQAGITTREGAACLVAQCMVESAYFRTTREIGGTLFGSRGESGQNGSEILAEMRQAGLVPS